MTELAGPGIMQHSYVDNRLGSVGILMPFMRRANRRSGGPCKDAARGRGGRADGQGPVHHARLLRKREGHQGGNRARRVAALRRSRKTDADGYFYIVDRKKDMILTAGYNVYPAEIERVIISHPAVAMVGVGSRPDPQKGEIPKAYIVLKNGATADANGIIEFCRNHLAAYKVPREVAVRARLADNVIGQDHAARAEDAGFRHGGQTGSRGGSLNIHRKSGHYIQAPVSCAISPCLCAAAARSVSPSSASSSE